MEKKIHLLLFIVFLCNLYLCANKTNNDSLAKITIVAKDYKNKCILFYLKNDNNPSVILDSNGYGEIQVPVKNAMFLNFGTKDSIFF